MDDPTLDVPGFGGRTASDRATMRASIEAMEAAIAPGTNAEFAAAVREVIASYRDKIEVIDGFVVAVAESDSSGIGRRPRHVGGRDCATTESAFRIPGSCAAVPHTR